MRINAFFLNLSHDGVLAPADRLVLIIHDGPGSCRSALSQVTCKTGDRWDDDDNSEFSSLLAGANASVNNSSADHVEDWGLLIASGRDCQVSKRKPSSGSDELKNWFSI